MLILEGIPAELPRRMIEANLKRYVENPEVTHERVEGYPHISTGHRIVYHSGYKTTMTSNKMWVAPGVFGWVKHSNQRPMSEWLPQCSKCLEEGHLASECMGIQRCSRCKALNHHRKKCTKCERCGRWGHKSDVCEDPRKTKAEQEDLKQQRKAAQEKLIEEHSQD